MKSILSGTERHLYKSMMEVEAGRENVTYHWEINDITPSCRGNFKLPERSVVPAFGSPQVCLSRTESVEAVIARWACVGIRR